MKNCYLFLLVFFCSCATELPPDKIRGEYRGAWFETRWKYRFYSDNRFDFESEGHYGFVFLKRTYIRKGDSLFLTLNNKNKHRSDVINDLYLIDGDSCIIDDDLRYDYCTTRDWSMKRNFKYPQIETSNTVIKKEVHQVLQHVLSLPEISERMDSTKSLILQSYFEVNKNYPYILQRFGLPVSVKTKEEIVTENIESYVKIEEINYNLDRIFIKVDIYPIQPGRNILGDYYKEDGLWKKYGD